jgi:hypothetical protein
MGTGTGTAISGDVFAGFTEAEKKFLQDVENFLVSYPKFGGTTPTNQALFTTFDVSIAVKGPRSLQVMCKKWCVGPDGRVYCCGM